MIDNWNCPVCKSYNDILNNHCVICKTDKPSWLTDLYQAEVEFNRGIYFGYGILGINQMDEDRQELHAMFFNQERILVRDMDNGQIRLGRQKLEMIALEAKARIAGRDAEMRERQASMTMKEKSWLVPSEFDPNVSDALGQVKERKKRMTQSEKTLEVLKNLGVAGADEIVAAMEKGAGRSKAPQMTFNVGSKTKQVTTTICGMCEIDRHAECLGSFKDTSGNSQQCQCGHNSNGEASKEFDPSNLGF